MSSDINVDNILETAENEIDNIKDNVAKLELKFQFMQQDITAIREAVTTIIYKKQINNETPNDNNYKEEEEISEIIDEEDEVAAAEQRLKFQFTTPGKPNNNNRNTRRRSFLLENTKYNLDNPRKVVYSAKLPDYAYIKLEKLTLLRTYSFYDQIALWQEKWEHPLRAAQLMSENVLNLLRD